MALAVLLLWKSSGVRYNDDKRWDAISVRNNGKIILFGNFGTGNFGNEATLQTAYSNLRRLVPEASFVCLCTFPDTASAFHKITSLPVSRPIITTWQPKQRVARLLRTMIFGIPSELYRWIDGFRTLKGADMVIVPGTGLLTDAHDLLYWGPYGVFKWSVLGKLRGCRLLFVSVGVGPLSGRIGRSLAKTALGLADFRSYRDVSSLKYLKEIGFTAANDKVYPDLAFSLPQPVVSGSHPRRRRVVGIGLMHHSGMYGDTKPDDLAYENYTDSLIVLVKRLLDIGYDIAVLIGQVGDPALEFLRLIKERLPDCDSMRIRHSPTEIR